MNFYLSSALVLDHLDKHPGSVKGSLAASGVAKTLSPAESKRILALVIETLKFKPILQSLLQTVPLLTVERLTFPSRAPRNTPSSPSLLLVLLHDLLLSPRRRIEASDKWPPKEAVGRHQARLRAELVRLQIRAGKSRVEDLAKRPELEGAEAEGDSGGGGDRSEAVGDGCRYVRYNPNVALHRDRRAKGEWGLGDLHAHLGKKGFVRLPKGSYPLKEKEYTEDEHLGEEVLVYSGRTSWWVKDPWYEAGAVVLQDKASCMPAQVLMHGWTDAEGACIDATAAPGNKTSYISALAPRARVTAFERDARRFKTLTKMLRTAECRNVTTVQGDFTQSDPKDAKWEGVSRICSGSGIVNRLDYLVENEAEPEDNEAKSLRLEKLAGFQLQMILHAFKFPNVTRVVYSTCSIHAEEDERVVASALASRLAAQRGWVLAPRDEVLPAWPRRGRADEFGGDQDKAASVIRCLPQDRTNGFFVSCFVRGDAVRSATTTTATASGSGAARAQAQAKADVGGQAKRGKKRARGIDSAPEPASALAPDGTAVPPAEDTSANGHQLAQGVNDEPKAKTAAQAERARRKKAAQKKRKIDGGGAGGAGEAGVSVDA